MDGGGGGVKLCSKPLFVWYRNWNRTGTVSHRRLKGRGYGDRNLDWTGTTKGNVTVLQHPYSSLLTPGILVTRSPTKRPRTERYDTPPGSVGLSDTVESEFGATVRTHTPSEIQGRRGSSDSVVPVVGRKSEGSKDPVRLVSPSWDCERPT